MKKTTRDVLGVTINCGKTMALFKPDGKPLLAGEIKAGERVMFEMRTGKVLRIGRKYLERKNP